MRLLLLLSLRNLASHRVKNLIVGALLGFGSFLWVVGTTLAQNIEDEMRRSISSSLTGDLQVYDKDARDPLSFFGGFSVGAPDIGRIPHFENVRDALLPLPEIRAVVPMGILIGSVTVQGELESALGELREWVWQRVANDNVPDTIEAFPIERVQRALKALHEDLRRSSRILRQDEKSQRALVRVEEVLDDKWWRAFPSSPLENLEHLDTQIAPNAPSGQMVYLRMLGTDMVRFQESFSRMTILRGRSMEAGERGMMLNQQFMDEHMKIRVLRTLDQIHQSVQEQGKRISRSPDLKSKVEQLERQSSALLSVIPISKEQEVDSLLGKIVGTEGSLKEKVTRYFRVNDENIVSRYDYFYQNIAPHVKVYAFDLGDLVPLTSFSQSGYPRSVNVRVRGIFTFEGLEKSELAGATNLLDLNTFRYLYGQPTQETAEELEEILDAADIEIIPREELEASLFSASDVETRYRDDSKMYGSEASSIVAVRQDPDARYDPQESERGLALHVAILVEEDVSLEKLMPKIESLNDDKKLGIQVVDWRQASGLVGQFVLVVRFVIYIALWIILAVAVVIMNNTLVISTLDRAQEIGTLRALGAQKRFVLWTTLMESFFLTGIASLAGIIASVFFLYFLNRVGIPAQSNVWIFLFGGPRLFPQIFITPFITSTVILLILSQVATLYPALLATRVSPIVAMQDVQT